MKYLSQIYKYRMYVQARADLTPEETAQYLASQISANGNIKQSPSAWPWRDTGEFVYASRQNNAKAFYRELRKIEPIIKIKAQRVAEPPVGEDEYNPDHVLMRAWRGFLSIEGTINNAADEVRHWTDSDSGRTACGIQFTAWHNSIGKPQCPTCLAAAVAAHLEMKEYL